MLKHVQIRAAALSYQDGLPSPNRDSDRNQNVIQAIKSGTSMPTRRQVQAEAPARAFGPEDRGEIEAKIHTETMSKSS